MSTSDFQLTEDKCIRILLKKYLFVVLDLFTFQDETKLWIPKEFIEKYQQLPFYDIIKHSEKYEDGSYYIDMSSSSMKTVIRFLMEENMDIDSLNLRDSYDIYKILIEYSVTINNVIQSDLLFHVKELFYKYLEDNNFDVSGYYCKDKESRIPIELFNLEEKEILVDDLLTFQRKEELLYYSPLFKMMNITTVNIAYYYASNIPLEYICPSCIKDIFPSLKQVKITVIIHYKKTELLLNPNSDDYIMEYARLLDNDKPRISKRKKYEYYTESDMNEYNNVSSLDLNKYYYSRDLINSYNEKREKNELPKLYKYIVNEAICINDYSQVEMNETEDEYILNDQVSIEYNDKTKDKTFSIDKVFSILGISQLLLLPSYLFKELTHKVNDNLFNTIMTTHVFPNVIELYEDDTYNFKSLFPDNLMSIIDTIQIQSVYHHQEEEIAFLLDNLVYTHSIHIDIKFLFISSWSEDKKKLDCIENYKQNIDSLDITFKNDDDQINLQNSLKRFLKSNVLKHLNNLTVTFDKNISIEYLTWISTLFNDNNFNIIHELTINLYSIPKASSYEYLTIYENILEKLIPKASIVDIEYCTMSFINRLIPKGCFLNTTVLFLNIKDIPDDNFCKLYSTNNFSQLKSIMFYNENENEWWISFIESFCRYMNNNNFPSSSIIQLRDYCSSNNFIYDPDTSIFRLKYDTHSYMNIIIGTNNEIISRYEIEMLFDCINENKTQNIKSLELNIYDEEHLSKLINFIINGEFPKLKDIYFNCYDIYNSYTYKRQLKDSIFIQENKVNYKFI
ncbi:hypothetical protein WA158_005913 [Blastocystis sp. Blastoise]